MEAGGLTEKKLKKGVEATPIVAKGGAEGRSEVAKEGAVEAGGLTKKKQKKGVEATPIVAKEGAEGKSEVSKEGAVEAGGLTEKKRKKGVEAIPIVAKEGAEGKSEVAKEPRVSFGSGFKIVRRTGYLSEYSGFGGNDEYVASEKPEGKPLFQCFQCKELNYT